MSDPFASPVTSSVPSSPATPARPARSVRRASIYSNLTSRSVPDPLATPPLPSSLSTLSRPSLDGFPMTPSTSPFAFSSDARRDTHHKSSNSLWRKPVPHSLDHLDLEVHALPHSTTCSPRIVCPNTSASTSTRTLPDSPESPESLPPRYILPVDPPLYPAHDTCRPIHFTLAPTGPRDDSFGIDLGVPRTHVGAIEELPRYAEEGETEPQTLARSMWKWGWLCPLLWAIGMCILWIPLLATEEEPDVEKAQKLEEMIVLLRKTELKYAKRCMYAFVGFIAILVLAVALAVIIPRFV